MAVAGAAVLFAGMVAGGEDVASAGGEGTEPAAVAEGEAPLPGGPGASAGREPGARTVVAIRDAELALRWCPPGSFEMGSPDHEGGRYDDETLHRVVFTNGFWIGETEVTQELWQKVMGSNPSFRKSGGRYPVENVSWNEYNVFLGKLNDLAPEGWSFSFPTEAQWEYACRAGSNEPYGGSGFLDEMGWYTYNSGGRTHPVAQKKPNDWGIYDMHGNVLEWCEDWYGSYPEDGETDGHDSADSPHGDSRVLRGGSSWRDARFCRSAFRFWNDPRRRFRLSGIRVVARKAGD